MIVVSLMKTTLLIPIPPSANVDIIRGILSQYLSIVDVLIAGGSAN